HDFDKALEIDPKDTNALYNRGNIKFQSAELEDAIKDFTEAVKIDAQFAKAYYGLGLAYQKLGNSDASCMNLKQANRLGYPDAKTALETYCK
ncbi:tetratricopeptide repeat protein, partial [Flectobacillus sp. BAB-3569]|uniref:tetratricopeptide repeat protein n=2 Tax=Bacteroidota/Chlorobiota group TaxID=68336 RepID=UPI000BD27E5D